jgi:phosphatidylglycerol:prolipoprotein diacylglycerol transferase
MIKVPYIDPVAIDMLGLKIHWYSMSYIFAAILGFIYVKFFIMKNDLDLIRLKNTKFFDDSIFYVMLGVILGARFGFVFFYEFSYYLNNPLKVFYVWEGGMSFHGAFLGVILAILFLSYKYKIAFLKLMDNAVMALPIGLFLGRIANFINNENNGEVVKNPNFIFGVLRENESAILHPVSLYQSFFDGVCLFFISLILYKVFKMDKKQGFLTGFTICYLGVSRFLLETLKLDKVFFMDTKIYMAQLLSFPMIVIGIYLMIVAKNLVNKIDNTKK